jgi:replicative DNA helicase
MTLVTVLDVDWTRAYGIDDLEQYLLEAPEPPPTPRRPDVPYIGPERPGDAFTASVDAADLLVASGWTLHHADRNGDRHYTRPGKERRDGASATVYADGHCCVWTDATSLEPRRWYDTFGLYAALHHNGDVRAAASELGRQGFGTRHVELTFIRPPAEERAPDPAVPWPDPVPLRDATDLPTFPVDALPPWIAAHAAAVANELQTPVDLPAMLGLAALSVVASKRVRVAVRGTWTEPANLYLVVAMPPGSGKSPAFSAMVGPLRDHERELVANSAATVAKREQERRILEKGMKRAEEKGDIDEAGRFLVDLMAAEPLRSPRLMIDDATPEAVVKVLGEQRGRIAILSPEGGLFDMMAGRYSEQSNLDPYLKAWSGDTIIVDRMSRDSVTIDNPAIVVGLAVQPSVIAALAERPEMAGRGLTSRFMYALPPNVVGHRNMIDPPTADPAIAAEYARRLLQLTKVTYDYPVMVPLDDDARRLFLEWRQALEDQRGPFGDMRPMSEWTTKLESSVARVALLLHIAEHGYAGTIGADTMRRAVEIGGYWIEHGKATHDLWVIDPLRSSALAILEWIKQRSVDEFTVRDLHRSLRRRFQRPAELIEPLMLLVETGWLRPLFDGPLEIGKGGKPSPSFAVHPASGARNTSTFKVVATVAPVSLKIYSEETSSSCFAQGGLEPGDTGATGDTGPEDDDPLAWLEGLL